MKDYLKKVVRKSYTENKLSYDLVLDQSERFTNYENNLFNNFLSTLTQHDFSLYPNLNKFKESISNFYGVKSNEITFNFGSDQCIKSIIDVFCESDSNIITSIPNFPMYKVYSDINNNDFIGVALNKDLSTDIEKIIKSVNSKTSLIILSNPTSPIGEYIHFNKIKKILDLGIPVLIDEAYIEFYDSKLSLSSKINEYNNLFVTRTFSKAMGAAGLRFGSIISNKTNISFIEKIKPMYETTGISLKYVDFLIKNYYIVDDYITQTMSEKKILINKLESKNFEIIDSHSNWIHFNDGFDNTSVMKHFSHHNILSKFVDIPYSKYKNWCRLTIQPNLAKHIVWESL